MRWTCLLVAMTLVCGCGGQDEKDTRSDQLTLAINTIQKEEANAPGVLLAVRIRDFSFEGAAGNTALNQGRPLKTNDLFRTASVTKTFTSVTTLVLVEQGDLDLDDAIADLLTPETITQLENGGYDTSRITLRQLLSHTAGIFDYTEAKSFYEIILSNPTHRWTRAEQIALAMDEGSPLNEPGEEYHYGDTHYILVGEILERASGQSLAEVFRSKLQFKKFFMDDIFLESLEPPPQSDSFGRLTHPYFDDIDTRGWDPSWDLWGGGGLVSNTGDLLRFFDALFNTETGIFEKEATLNTLLTMPKEGLGAFDGLDGGMGINRFFHDNIECFAGLGFFTTWVVRCPELDLTFASTQNQSDPNNPDLIVDEVLKIAHQGVNPT